MDFFMDNSPTGGEAAMKSQAYYLTIDGKYGVAQKQLSKGIIVLCTGFNVLNQTFKTHNHTRIEEYYLLYMVKGEMKIWIDNEEIIILAGQVVVFFPNNKYRYAMHNGIAVQYYWVHFSGNQIADILSDCRIYNCVINSVGIIESVFQDFKALFQEFAIRDHLFYYQTEAKMLSILTSISRNFIDFHGTVSKANIRFIESLTYIHQNFTREISIAELASKEYLSVSRYRTIFKKITGHSPKDYISNLRINQAKRLLHQTNLSICEIAGIVGYQDQLYFSRVFVKCVGCSPSSFRKILYKK